MRKGLGFKLIACLLQFLGLARSAVAFLADVIEQFVGAQALGVDVVSGRLNNLRLESEAGGNREGVGTSGESNG